MENFKYCIACLATNVKMYSFSSTPFGALYSQLVQIPTYEEDHVCFECARLLHKYHKFKSKCYTVYNIISSIRNKYIQVTQCHIANIDRKQFELESSLVLTPVVLCNNEPYIHSDNEESTAIGLEEDDQLDDENNKINIESDAIDTDENDDSDVVFVEYLEDHFDSDESSIITTEHKSEVIEPKTKKRKAICKSEIKQDLSDDEPLPKSISNRSIFKKKTSNKKQQIDLGYFEDYATVVPLSPEDARKEVLLRKESNNYKNSPYKCDKCFRGFGLMRAFENHMIRHRIEYGKYECEFCQLRFPRQPQLGNHRWSSHKRKFCCKLCPYACFGISQARNHVELHKGTKYPCKDCGEIFSMPNSLLMHKHIKHLNMSSCECVCENCGCVFGSQRGLDLHQKWVHRHVVNNEEGPECNECGVRFTSDTAWKRHLVLSTKHNVSNGCKTCGDTFPNADELKSHTRVHAIKRTIGPKLPASCRYCDKLLQTRAEYKSHVMSKHPNTNEGRKLTIKAQTPFVCKICGQMFKCDKLLQTRAEYKSHVMSKHPNTNEARKLTIKAQTPFVCEICGQMFKSQCLLVYHQRAHTGERPCKCGECGKSFASPITLSIHRAIHKRTRKHRCELCGRYLANKSALAKHVKSHLGVRSHKCVICDKSFIHKCLLQQHVKHVHEKVPWPKKKRKRNATEESAQYSE